MAGIIDSAKDKMDKMPKSDRMMELEKMAKSHKLDDKGKAELERLRSGSQHSAKQ